MRDDGPKFSLKPLTTNLASVVAHLTPTAGSSSSSRQVSTVSMANFSMLVAFASGELYRWYTQEDESVGIDFGGARPGIAKVFQDPMGFHAIVTCTSGENWYVDFETKARVLPKLEGHLVECSSWDGINCSESSTGDLLMGTIKGEIIHTIIENGEAKNVHCVFRSQTGPIVAITQVLLNPHAATTGKRKHAVEETLI